MSNAGTAARVGERAQGDRKGVRHADQTSAAVQRGLTLV